MIIYSSYTKQQITPKRGLTRDTKIAFEPDLLQTLVKQENGNYID